MNFIILKNSEDFSNSPLTRENFIDFMHKHLDRFGDTKAAIGLSIDYAFSTEPGKGGFCIIGVDNNEVVGGLIMNKTGMADYIPENILVYVAVHEEKRGKGYGKQIIEKSFEISDTNVKLHVEYDNPAKRLYERLGFVNKYAEMRYTKK